MRDDELRQVAVSRLGRVLRGKYRLDAVLGLGGMATVYAATHRNKKRFAIKMLHPELSHRETIRTRFLREGYVANSVDHPGAVAVLDDDVAEDGSAFLVMELLEGSALDELAAKHEGHKLPLALVLSLGDALLDVLAAAHAKGIVHRDLKPANVFLTNDGRLEVLDFGIARLRDETTSPEHATQTGAMLGTPAFMAPEQAMGESSKIDAQTDLWAVGATLFKLLSNALVHEGDNASQLMVRAATQKARQLASVAPDVPKPVADVVDRALAFDRKDRWESAGAMRDALAKASVEATGAPMAPLPKTERVTGLEATVTSDAKSAPASSNAGFDPTVDASGVKPSTTKPALTTAEGLAAAMGAPSAKAHGSRGKKALLAGVVLVGVAASVLGWRHTREASAPQDAAPSSATFVLRPGRPPATPQAAAAYEAAIQADHDGNPDEAEKNYKAAIASDPSLGAAHLRLALLHAAAHEADAHADYRKAVEHRATLGDLDAALLDAWEPTFRDPPDRGERTKRLEALASRFPADPYVQTLLAVSLQASQRFADSNGALDRALVADARYVPAYVAETQNAYLEGDDARGRATTERCLKASPSAVSCIVSRSVDDNDDHRCADVKADARRILAVDPTSHLAYLLLATSTFALGEPLDTTVEALHQGDAQIVDPTERRSTELYTDEHLFLIRGDFPGAEKALGDIVGLAATKRSIDPFEPLLRQIDLALETGDLAGAKALVKRARALVGALPTSEHDIGTEARLALASVHAGVTTRDELHAEQQRLHVYQRELDGRNAGRVDPTLEWSTIYAVGARDESDGREAMAALDELGGVELKPLLADHSRDLGSAYALGGRYAEAAPLLENAVGGCWELIRVPQFQRARYLLGLSREKTGDLAGAKQAYDSVIARWGDAKPRSLTVDRARAGLGRLAKGSAAR